MKDGMASVNGNGNGGGNGKQSSAPSSFKRGVSRIASGLKRPKSRANLIQEPPTPKNEDDGGISTPWNFQVRPSSPLASAYSNRSNFTHMIVA